MKPLFRNLFLSCALVASVSTPRLASAQETNSPVSVGTDLVSSYVWRGVPQDPFSANGSPNIQPYISVSLGNFTLGTWGSGSFTGTVKEVDLYLSYAFGDHLSVTLTDYNWNFTRNYFDYGKETDHAFEASIAYSDIASLPLSLSLNTFFAGADKRANGDQAYSTYVELGFACSDDVLLFAGASVLESPLYGTTGFGVTNVGVKVSKELTITDRFSLPLFGLLGFNPTSNGAFLVAGISF